MHGFIYAIHDRLSGKVYVGQTVRSVVDRRWYEHRWALERGCAANRHLQSAWAAHKGAAFEFTTLEQVEAATPEELKDRLTQQESHWMNHYRSQGVTLFNAQDAGDSTAYLRRGMPSPKKGVPLSEDQRQKVAASLKGNQRRRGTSTSEQGRANIAASKKGQPSPNRGKALSADQKEALRLSHLGSTHTESTRAKMRESAKGRTWTLVDGHRVYSGIKGRGAA